jgi:hypothetical protein
VGLEPGLDRSDDMTTLQHLRSIIRHAVCGVLGHDTLLQFEQHRLSLRCASCGYQTAGWTIGDIPSRGDVGGAHASRSLEARHAA